MTFYDPKNTSNGLSLSRSIGSIVQGIHRIPTLMASTNAKHGSLPKSIWKTLPCRNSGFNKGAATTQIPTEARDNRILVFD